MRSNSEKIKDLELEIESLRQEDEQLKEEIDDPDLDEDGEAGELYDEFLSECYPDYEIEGVTISPYRILKECDPVAYRQGLLSYFDDDDQRARLNSVSEAISRRNTIDDEITDLERDIEELKEEKEGEEE